MERKQESFLSPDAGSANADISTPAAGPLRTPWDQDSGSRWYSTGSSQDSSVAPGTTTAAGNARPLIKGDEGVAKNFEKTLPQMQSLFRRQLEQQDVPWEMAGRRRRVVMIAMVAVAACLLALVAFMGRRVIGFQFDRMVALFRFSGQPTSADTTVFQVKVSDRQTLRRKVPSERARLTSLEQSEQSDATPAQGTSTSPAEKENGGKVIAEVIPPWALQPPLQKRITVRDVILKVDPPWALEPSLTKPRVAPNVIDLPKPF